MMIYIIVIINPPAIYIELGILYHLYFYQHKGLGGNVLLTLESNMSGREVQHKKGTCSYIYLLLYWRYCIFYCVLGWY